MLSNRITRHQYIGLALLALMIIAVEIFIHLVPQRSQSAIALTEEDSLTLAQLGTPAYTRYTRDTIDIYLHPFDPNTADSSTLVHLGLRPWQARNILRYRAKGGHYRQPTDLKRLWGMTDSLYATLEPYIEIAPIEADSALRSALDSLPQQRKTDTILCLNTADTTELQLLRGIGRYTASRIVRYREQLGGYTSPEQLREIENLHTETLDSVLPHLIICGDSLRQIPINKTGVESLTRHPYITFTQAQAIYELRRKKVRLTSIQDLKVLPELTDSDLQRLSPYITFD